VTPGRKKMPTGTYTIVARWPSGLERSGKVQLQPGGIETIRLSLEIYKGMKGWNLNQWHAEGTWYVHAGKGIASFNPTPTDGTFVFTAEARGGYSLSWVLDDHDPDNPVVGELNSKSFVRKAVARGVTWEPPNPLGKTSFLLIANRGRRRQYRPAAVRWQTVCGLG